MTSPVSFGCSKSSSSSIICEEVFDEGYQPSNEEIRDYATRIGIDPEKEPYLLYIAKDGLMQALPPNWQICYNDKYQAYYYANRVTKVTQWEHPLDVEFKKVVEKARKNRFILTTDDKSVNDDPSLIDSGIKSLQEKEECDGNSMDNNFGGRFLSPINGAVAGSAANGANRKNVVTIGTPGQIGLGIKSDDHTGRNLTTFGQLKEDASKPKGFTLTGTGSMFLKSNTTKSNIQSPLQQFKESFGSSDRDSSLSSGVKGILRDSSLSDVRANKGTALVNPDNGSFDLEDRKSVRFNFENKEEIDVKTESLEKSSEEKSSIDDEDEVEEDDVEEDESDEIKWNEVNQPIKPEENYVTSIRVGLNPIKPMTQPKPTPPAVKTLTTFGKHETETEIKLQPNVKPLYDDESLTESEDSVKPNNTAITQQMALEKLKLEEDKLRVEMVSQLEKLKSDYSGRTKLEYEKFVADESTKIEKLKIESLDKFDKVKQQLDENYERDRKQYENELKQSVEEINANNAKVVDKLKLDLHEKNRLEIDSVKTKLQTEFDDKRKEIINEHRKSVEVLQKNHNEILEELERDLKTEEELLKKDHQMNLAQMKDKLSHEIDIERQRMREMGEDRLYEKIRCEKRLLEDKYRCLKEKYIRLKTDVKLSLERRNNRRKEHQQPTSITTGSETERSNSNHLNNRAAQQPVSAPIDYGRPPLTPKLPQSKLAQQHQINQLPLPPPPTSTIPKEPLKKFGTSTAKYLKQIQNYNDDTTSISQSDTTVSNQYPKIHRYITSGTIGDNGNSDSEVIKVARNFYNNNNNTSNIINNNNMKETPGRQRKKIFTRMKSASTSRLNTNSNNKRDQMVERPCTPVENLRRQLQKLEDLEDQFPDNSLDTTYHLRYPFTDIVSNSHKGSSELEFFKHRIHLERDSVRRAKESLRTQRTNFRARQREIKQRHKCSARHTLDQLIQEEKELTEMEVNLHRTRALLGEKVIRLRHLEQSLQRIYEKEKPDFIGNNGDDTRGGTKDDATLSDLSSHSSSGFSSTDFATDTNQMNNTNRHVKENIYQESSEIIQSLENLNAEIREIWEILSKQQAHGLTPPPSIFYPEMSWGLTSMTQSHPITTSIMHTNPPNHQPTIIPTLADRLETYRQLATGRATTTVAGIMTTPNAANTIVSQSLAGHYTTSLVERTRDLRNWLRQAKNEHEMLSGSQQADL